MEDTATVVPLLTPSTCFVGVYDGHGGRNCAEYAAERLYQHLGREISARKIQKRGSDRSLKQCFISAFERIDADLAADDDVPENCGTTAVTCVIRSMNWKRYLHVANVGDSKAILSRNGKALCLSTEHRLCNKSELERVRRAGGLVINQRVGGCLSVTRSLGHCQDKHIVSGTPTVSEYLLTRADEFVVLVTDGISDVLDDQTIVDYVKHGILNGKSVQRICRSLIGMAKDRNSRDNLTAIVVKF